jgi:hypothetical protein
VRPSRRGNSRQAKNKSAWLGAAQAPGVRCCACGAGRRFPRRREHSVGPPRSMRGSRASLGGLARPADVCLHAASPSLAASQARPARCRALACKFRRLACRSSLGASQGSRGVAVLRPAVRSGFDKTLRQGRRLASLRRARSVAPSARPCWPRSRRSGYQRPGPPPGAQLPEGPIPFLAGLRPEPQAENQLFAAEVAKPQGAARSARPRSAPPGPSTRFTHRAP